MIVKLQTCSKCFLNGPNRQINKLTKYVPAYFACMWDIFLFQMNQISALLSILTI